VACNCSRRGGSVVGCIDEKERNVKWLSERSFSVGIAEIWNFYSDKPISCKCANTTILLAYCTYTSQELLPAL